MEDSQTPIELAEDRSAETGDTLRTLRERAHDLLREQLIRIEQTEAELGERIQQLVEELGHDHSAQEQAQNEIAELHRQLEARSNELAEAQSRNRAGTRRACLPSGGQPSRAECRARAVG